MGPRLDVSGGTNRCQTAFDKQGFVASQPEEVRPLLSLMSHSQLFFMFIQDRKRKDEMEGASEKRNQLEHLLKGSRGPVSGSSSVSTSAPLFSAAQTRNPAQPYSSNSSPEVVGGVGGLQQRKLWQQSRFTMYENGEISREDLARRWKEIEKEEKKLEKEKEKQRKNAERQQRDAKEKNGQTAVIRREELRLFLDRFHRARISGALQPNVPPSYLETSAEAKTSQHCSMGSSAMSKTHAHPSSPQKKDQPTSPRFNPILRVPTHRDCVSRPEAPLAVQPHPSCGAMPPLPPTPGNSSKSEPSCSQGTGVSPHGSLSKLPLQTSGSNSRTESSPAQRSVASHVSLPPLRPTPGNNINSRPESPPAQDGITPPRGSLPRPSPAQGSKLPPQFTAWAPCLPARTSQKGGLPSNSLFGTRPTASASVPKPGPGISAPSVPERPLPSPPKPSTTTPSSTLSSAPSTSAAGPVASQQRYAPSAPQMPGSRFPLPVPPARKPPAATPPPRPPRAVSEVNTTLPASVKVPQSRPQTKGGSLVSLFLPLSSNPSSPSLPVATPFSSSPSPSSPPLFNGTRSLPSGSNCKLLGAHPSSTSKPSFLAKRDTQQGNLRDNKNGQGADMERQKWESNKLLNGLRTEETTRIHTMVDRATKDIKDRTLGKSGCSAITDDNLSYSHKHRHRHAAYPLLGRTFWCGTAHMFLLP